MTGDAWVPRCSGQRIRQRLVHSQTRVAGFCAVAGAARPLASRYVASRRACMGKPRERQRTRRTPPPPSRFRSFTRYTSPSGCPSADPFLRPFPASSRPRRPPRSRAADAIAAAEERKNEGDGRREGEVERARVRPARKSGWARKWERWRWRRERGLLLLLGSPPPHGLPPRRQSVVSQRWTAARSISRSTNDGSHHLHLLPASFPSTAFRISFALSPSLFLSFFIFLSRAYLSSLSTLCRRVFYSLYLLHVFPLALFHN